MWKHSKGLGQHGESWENILKGWGSTLKAYNSPSPLEYLPKLPHAGKGLLSAAPCFPILPHADPAL